MFMLSSKLQSLCLSKAIENDVHDVIKSVMD